MDDLHQRLARALGGEIHDMASPGRVAALALAALGLDDLDAAAKRIDAALDADGWPEVSTAVVFDALFAAPLP